MFSFLTLVICYLISVIYSLLQDCIKNDGKHFFKYAIQIILLLIAVDLKSINL